MTNEPDNPTPQPIDAGPMPELTTEQAAAQDLAIEIARLATDSRCEDVIVLDLRGRSPVTDFFVIASGTSDRQMRAVGEEIAHVAAQRGNPVWHVAGKDSDTWVLLDFVDVVVHLFSEEARHHYDLELLWGDAPRVEWARDAETT